MDNLEKIIFENRDAFNERTPDGHLQRFEKKLTRMNNQQKKKRFFIQHFGKVAAAVIIILLSANLIVYITGERSTQTPPTVASVELTEAEHYYVSQVNMGIQTLEHLANQGVGTPLELKQIRDEFAQMDSLFLSLKEELKTNPNDERLINAMIEHYQTKLEIVNTILSDLKQIKASKYNSHESIEM